MDKKLLQSQPNLLYQGRHHFFVEVIAICPGVRSFEASGGGVEVWGWGVEESEECERNDRLVFI